MDKENPLKVLETFGQSIWLDLLSRRMILSGELDRLIREDGLSGMTSNPTIFEKEIGGSADYDDAIRRLAVQGKTPAEIYESLAVEDIQLAADRFRPLFERVRGRDGYVSLEVSPLLARDTEGTIAEAKRLWRAVNRPNVMIKVPATDEGIPAIRQLTRDGINVNITLLFGLPRYRDVASAYLDGLEERQETHEPLEHVVSVASFFLSRIDVMVDGLLEKRIGPREAEDGVYGEVAVSCAKIAYRMFQESVVSARFARLRAIGARPQRLLWASTGTKNPHYSDIKYVEPLIGPDTINTVPLETLIAYRDHGEPAYRLRQGLADAERVLQRLPSLGVDIDSVTRALEEEGIAKFVKPYRSLLDRISEKMDAFARQAA